MMLGLFFGQQRLLLDSDGTAFPFASSVLPLISISTLSQFLTLSQVPRQIKEAQTSDVLLFGHMQTGSWG